MTKDSRETTRTQEGLGQIIADKIVYEMNNLLAVYPFLSKDPKFTSLKKFITQQSGDPDTEELKMRMTYENALYPLLQQIRQSIAEGQVLSFKNKRSFPAMPEPKTFDELRDIVITEINQELPEDAKDSASDSVIAGDIKISDIFLPYQREVREMVFGQLRNVESREEDEPEAPMGQEIFDILPLDDEAIRAAVEAGKLDREVGEMILATREDIRGGFGASDIDKCGRMAMIRKAHLGIVKEEPRISREKRKPITTAEVAQALRELGRERLTDKEECVVRMRAGAGAGKEESLERDLSALSPANRAKIALIEAEALERMGIRVGKPKGLPARKGPALSIVSDESGDKLEKKGPTLSVVKGEPEDPVDSEDPIAS